MNILRFVPFFSLPCCFQIFVLHFDHSQQSVTLTLKFPGKFFQLAFLLCHFFQQLFFLFLQRREYFPRCPKSVIQFSGQCTGLLLQIMHFPIKFNHPVGLPADSYLTVLIFPEPLTDVGHFFIEPAQMMGILPQINTHIFFVQRHDNGLLDKLCIKFWVQKNILNRPRYILVLPAFGNSKLPKLRRKPPAITENNVSILLIRLYTTALIDKTAKRITYLIPLFVCFSLGWNEIFFLIARAQKAEADPSLRTESQYAIRSIIHHHFINNVWIDVRKIVFIKTLFLFWNAQLCLIGIVKEE